MRLVGGAETSKGRVREQNQDRPLLTAWVAGVADGMGGHRAGERAAQLAASELAMLEGPLGEGDLVAAVHAANQRILDEGRDPDLRGMGTTLVALALDGEQVVVVNVGDSRAYQLVGDDLAQLTEDHSLVEDLVRQGQLSPEQARSHPQRNIVTRALGIGPDLDVDVFRRPARAGDRYLLCSDGLFNEVEPERIATELRRWGDPGEVARELVRLANEAGARDNVTCVVVDVHEGTPAPAGTGTGQEAAGAAGGATGGGATGGGPGPAPAPAGGEAAPGRQRSRRRRSLAALPWVLAVAAIAGVAVGGTLWWDRSGYFVDEVDGEVAILQGRPGGVLWLEPRVVEPTGLAVDELTGASRQRLEDPPVGSLSQARQLVRSLDTVPSDEATATGGGEAGTTTTSPSAGAAPGAPTTAPTTTTTP